MNHETHGDRLGFNATFEERLSAVEGWFAQERLGASLEDVGIRRGRLARAFKAFERDLAAVIGSTMKGASLSRHLWRSDFLSRKLEPEQLALAFGLKDRFDALRDQLTDHAKAQFPLVCQRFGAALQELESDYRAASLEEVKIRRGLLAEALKAFERDLRLVIGSAEAPTSHHLWSKDGGLSRKLEPEQLALAKSLRARFFTLLDQLAERAKAHAAVAREGQPPIATLASSARERSARAAGAGTGATTPAGVKEEIALDGRQLQHIPGLPRYLVLPRDVWSYVTNMPYATIRVLHAPQSILFLPGGNRPGLTVITDGSVTMPNGTMRRVEAAKALIVPGRAEIAECEAGYVRIGVYLAARLIVNGPGWVSVDYLQPSEEYIKSHRPRIDVPGATLVCREIKWIYPIRYGHVTYVRGPLSFVGKQRESNTETIALSTYDARKDAALERIFHHTKLSVTDITATFAQMSRTTNRGMRR